MPNCKPFIPKISKNVDFAEFNNGEILCTHHTSGQRLRLNKATYDLLQLANGERELEQIVLDYNRLYGENTNKETIQNLFEGIMKQYGIIYTDIEVSPDKANPSYLRLRIDLIKSSFSSHYTRFFFPIFHQTVFWTLNLSLFIILSFLSWTYFAEIYRNLFQISIVDIIISILLMGIGLIAHEFGHITACDYFGAKHGNIGFGFYLFTPVMYADVTDIWRLPTYQRLIVNLAGIYMGNIVATIFFIMYAMTNNYLFLYIFYLQYIESLYNLNPFVKYDGYWILSDILHIPNLHKEAYSRALHLKSHDSFTLKDWLLALYGITSFIFIISFIIGALIIAPESLLKFPIDIYNAIINVLFRDTVFNLANWLTFIPSFIFYYLVIKLFYTIIKRKMTKHE